jgi:hypothetical protein
MEKSAIAKFSAYTRVCQAFIQACESEGVNPVDCLLAIAGFLDVSIEASGHSQAGAVSSASTPSVSQPASAIKLTKEQAEEAKRLAREEKARKAGLKPSEVNLTPAEAKNAKAQMRKRLAAGETVVSLTKPSANNNKLTTKSASKSGVNPSVASAPGPKTKSSPSTPSLKEEIEEVTGSGKKPKPVGVQNEPTGDRATAKTRLETARRNCLRNSPASQEDPTVLHLVAYSNHFTRLLRQWTQYQTDYEIGQMLDPTRNLLNPFTLPKTRGLLEKAVRGLRQQGDSPGTYILQSDDGSTFWDKDKPSRACPHSLSAPIPPEVLLEIGWTNGPEEPE